MDMVETKQMIDHANRIAKEIKDSQPTTPGV
jgi:hypothetical protein